MSDSTSREELVELLERVGELEVLLEDNAQVIEALRAENAELKRRLASDSRNPS